MSPMIRSIEELDNSSASVSQSLLIDGHVSHSSAWIAINAVLSQREESSDLAENSKVTCWHALASGHHETIKVLVGELDRL